jgi:hypothetical protein
VPIPLFEEELLFIRVAGYGVKFMTTAKQMGGEKKERYRRDCKPLRPGIPRNACSRGTKKDLSDPRGRCTVTPFDHAS